MTPDPTFSPASPYTGGATTVTISEPAPTAGPAATVLYCTDTNNTCTPSTTYAGSVAFSSTGYIRTQATLLGVPSSNIVSWSGTLGSTGASHLARSFNGTSDYLQSASALSIGSPGTISIWFRMNWTAFANDDKLAFETSSNFNGNTGAIFVDPDESGSSNFQFGAQTVGGDVNAHYTCSFPRPSAGAWHSYLLMLSTAVAPVCAAYVDGVSQTVTPSAGSDYVAATFTGQVLNVMSRNGTSLFGAGSISDIAIWTTDESSNISTLNNCSNSPASVERKQSEVPVAHQPDFAGISERGIGESDCRRYD